MTNTCVTHQWAAYELFRQLCNLNHEWEARRLRVMWVNSGSGLMRDWHIVGYSGIEADPVTVDMVWPDEWLLGTMEALRRLLRRRACHINREVEAGA